MKLLWLSGTGRGRDDNGLTSWLTKGGRAVELDILATPQASPLIEIL